ncbi:site-specific tyrosine recombinase XerC [candidate division CSSED10-310 bacterium]|uniref:Site-specific tyrosine recombinase XerC n=1 Tax=candidate division CSSED10-310 bacterium TaxID=2855610 RepID=A0ABV6Z293_UNCC1
MNDLLRNDPLTTYIRKFLTWLEVAHYSPRTVLARRKQLVLFKNWCFERYIDTPFEVDRRTVEQYRRFLFYKRKKDGTPLAVGSQCTFLVGVRVFFSWLAKNNHILYNPTSELELPKLERMLPRSVLSVAEVDQIMDQPDVTTALGIRDRAILETLYSSGIRRLEIVNLGVNDVDLDKGVLFIRQGKGNRDRVVPIGSRSCSWIEKYLHEVRPYYLRDMDLKVLFLTVSGRSFHPDIVTRMIRDYVKQAGIDCGGACHLFRHSMATSMLENGADIRHIQLILGHASLNTTQIYTKVSILKLKEVHSKTHPARLKRDQA